MSGQDDQKAPDPSGASPVKTALIQTIIEIASPYFVYGFSISHQTIL